MGPEILFVLSLLQGYLLGSINSSILVGKFHGIDIRDHGSGNAGMTNTLRTLGKASAVIVFLGDMLKGVIACIIGFYLLNSFYGFSNAGLLAGGVGALLGHNWPLYFGFKGGKGVLTTISVILMMDWRIGLSLFGIFVVVVLVSRFISLGSIVGAVCFPIIALVFKDELKTDNLFITFACLVSAIVVIKHSSNIQRIFQGKENKFSLKKTNKVKETASKQEGAA